MILFATAAFGLEGLVAAELKRLGYTDAKGEIGGARFEGTLEDAFFCNLRLRMADRVQIILAEQECYTFEELFRLVSSIPWEMILRTDGKYHITGQCARSQLMSIRDCQSIAKKALIERMKQRTGKAFFPEIGAEYRIDVSIHQDRAKVTLDTSGDALNKRGYRTWNGEAPIRETLAAALVELSPWRPGMRLHDPCCGTGTLLIEAAFRQTHRAPGLKRSFACEKHLHFPAAKAAEMRYQAEADVLKEPFTNITGSDINPEALELARRHVKQAELGGRIQLTQQDLAQLQLPETEGVFLCNPPYGERLSDRKSCEKLYGEMRKLQNRHPGWSLAAITADPGFEKAFGRRADKRRRLYNGRLECSFMIFLPR